VAGPVHLPTPRGVTAHHVQSAQQMLAAVQSRSDPRMFHRHRRSGRLASGQYGRPEDQERRLGRSAGTGFVENPDILATVAQSARPGAVPVLRGLCGRKPRSAAARHAKRLRKDVPLLVGNIGPATFGRTTTPCCWWMPGHRELPRAPKTSWGNWSEMARRLAAAPGAERVPPLLTCLKIAHHTSNYDGPRGGDYVRYVDSCCVPVRCTAVPSMG
jgi:phosphopantothenoylcysteine decarboxylase/phosphopantothenate--cysteine ligase